MSPDTCNKVVINYSNKWSNPSIKAAYQDNNAYLVCPFKVDFEEIYGIAVGSTFLKRPIGQFRNFDILTILGEL